MNVAPSGNTIIFILYNFSYYDTFFDYGKQYTESWKVNVVNLIIKLVIFTFEQYTCRAYVSNVL